jgi:phosphomannomutase/phosphoglucomutase
VNGVRVALDDGTWDSRASSNTPSLIVVAESPTSRERMRCVFADIAGRLAKNANVGA